MQNSEYSVESGTEGTPRAAGAIVLGALVLLILINRGFRGVNVAGAGVKIG